MIRQTNAGAARRAWAAVVRPEVTGKVVIGVPDDYASSLLPSVLKKFSATYPKVEIQVMGLPSSALAPLIRTAPSISCAAPASGVVRRLHPPRADGVGRDDERAARGEERPLPIAVFMPGSVARENAIRSLERAKVPYRTSYESRACSGCSHGRSRRAVAPLRCAIPAQLSMLGRSHGLPDLPPLELILARSTKSKRPPCDFLAEQLMEDLQRQTGQTAEA